MKRLIQGTSAMLLVWTALAIAVIADAASQPDPLVCVSGETGDALCRLLVRLGR